MLNSYDATAQKKYTDEEKKLINKNFDKACICKKC